MSNLPDPNEEMENMVKGLKIFVAITSILLALLIIFCIASCQPHRAVIFPEGQVVDRNGDEFLIIWRDMADKPYSYAYNWVYEPGLGLTPVEELEVFIIIQKKQP